MGRANDQEEPRKEAGDAVTQHSNRYDVAAMSRPSGSGIPEGIRQTVDDLFDTWTSVRARNARLTRYYEMRNQIRDFGIAVPPNLKHVDEVVGWAQKAVDVRVNRSMFDGFVFRGKSDEDLDALVSHNRMRQLVRRATRSMLTHGCSAITVMRGGDGQPAAKVRSFSANQCCMLWDKDADGIGAGVVLADVDRDGNASRYVVHMPDRVTVLRRDYGTLSWYVESDEDNPVGSMLMVPLANDADDDKPLGHPVLTPELTSIVDKAVRDVLRMDVGAEFFTTPQRWATGIAASLFGKPLKDEDGNPVIDEDTGEPVLVTDEAKKLRAYLGSLWLFSKDEDGDSPKLGQFPAGDAKNFIATYENDAQRFSGASLVPLAQLGVMGNTYTSSDALSASNDPLILDVQCMNDGIKDSLWQVARLMMAVSGGLRLDQLTDRQNGVMASFRDPSMPTMASRADAWSKLGALDSSIVGTRVFYEGVGLDQATIDRLEAEKRDAQSESILSSIFTSSKSFQGGDERAQETGDGAQSAQGEPNAQDTAAAGQGAPAGVDE